ncbi:MAG: hypothetical protein LUC91_04805, partial [Prevotella sp.]|nr:hypothetical protein [Prevotella sp.]
YIGANLSILPDQVEKLNKLREMRDIFSSVVSSNDRNLSDFQSKRLKELYLFLSEKDPAYDELAKVSLSNKEKKEVFAIIKGRIEYFMERIKRLDIFGLKSKVNPNPTINWVECEIEKVKSEIEKCKLLSPEDGEVIVSEFKMISQKAENGQELSALYIAWVNDVLISRQYNGKISSIKMQLSDQITEKASDIIGDQWKESKIRNYLNDLRRHIGGYEFNHEWNNGLLSSMAAVLIKGDVWDSLLHFMQSKEMNDYRIAFSLYGELNGFANLPRDFTDILLEQKREYVAEVYNEFYGQLFDKRISNKDIDNDVTESKIETQTNDVTSPHRDNIKGDKNKWQDEILNYAELKIKKNKKLLLKSLNEALGKSKDIQELFDILPQYEGWKSGKKKENDDFKNLKAYFLDDKIVHTDSIENKNNSVKQLELFDDNQSPIQQEKKVEIIKDENTSTVVNDNSYDSILSNESWIDLCIKSFIPISDEDVKKQFKKDAIWFINNHKEVYYDSKGEKHQGCYHDRDKSNHQVIKRFKDFLDKRKNPVKQKTQWLGLIYKTIPIDEIINYLSSKYGDGKSTN